MTAEDGKTYLERLDSKEPVFILRAQDVLALPAILYWINLASTMNVPRAKIVGALAVAVEFGAWETRKVPD